jgi:hypothetical protein
MEFAPHYTDGERCSSANQAAGYPLPDRDIARAGRVGGVAERLCPRERPDRGICRTRQVPPGSTCWPCQPAWWSRFPMVESIFGAVGRLTPGRTIQGNMRLSRYRRRSWGQPRLSRRYSDDGNPTPSRRPGTQAKRQWPSWCPARRTGHRPITLLLIGHFSYSRTSRCKQACPGSAR